MCCGVEVPGRVAAAGVRWSGDGGRGGGAGPRPWRRRRRGVRPGRAWRCSRPCQGSVGAAALLPVASAGRLGFGPREREGCHQAWYGDRRRGLMRMVVDVAVRPGRSGVGVVFGVPAAFAAASAGSCGGGGVRPKIGMPQVRVFGRCAMTRTKVLPGLIGPATTAPVGVVSLLGGVAERVGISHTYLELVLSSGESLDSDWIGTMATSVTPLLCWKHRDGRHGVQVLCGSPPAPAAVRGCSSGALCTPQLACPGRHLLRTVQVPPLLYC